MKTFRLPFASRLARLRTVTAFGAGLLLAQPATAAVAVPLRADYRFTGGFNSFTPGAPPLAPLGPVSFGPGVVDGQARTVLNFSANDGVSLAPMSSVVPGPSYSLVLLFAFDEASDWRRILDFKNAASDTTKVGNASLFLSSRRIEARNAPKTPTAHTTVIQLGIS